MIHSIEIPEILSVARSAGDAIMSIYNDADFSQVVDYKSDNSPLTMADKASHAVIVTELLKINTGVPVISEEGKEVPYRERKEYNYYWLVDPLDGTKEFIKRNGEFTVNIALIYQNRPVLGVIYTPATDTMYYGVVDKEEAYKQTGGEEARRLKVNHRENDLVAVRSKSHAAPEEEEVLAKYNATRSISVGSSLKFCMVAEGKADIYYRHGPTMEWDTAAGQAVLEAAGGRVYQGTGNEQFVYNKESLLNGSFLATGF